MAYKRSAMMEERLASNRERIILATRKLIAAGGFREASIAAVAARAGVSTGLIYRHFPSKAELFVEVLTAAVDREITILEGIVAKGGSATDQLGAAIESFVRRALAGPNLAYAFIAEPVDIEVDVERIRGRHRFGNIFRSILAKGIAQSEFPEQDIEAGAACIVGAFTEALVGPTSPTLREARDDARIVDAIRGFCLRAVGTTRVGTR